MFPRKFGLFLSSAVLFSHAACAAETVDDAPPDAKTLALQIKSFAALRSQQKKAFFQTAEEQLDKILGQTGDCANYALECMREVRYKDTKGGPADSAKWKKDNLKLYSDHDLEKAASLHLQYLVLTLKRAGVESSEPVQQATWDYLAELFKAPELLAEAKKDPHEVKFSVYDQKQGITNEMVGNMQDLEKGKAMPDDPRSYIDELLDNPVTAGWVAKTLGLDGELGNLQDWETSAGSFSGILEKNIRPYLRKEKDPRLPSTWDYEASFLGTIAGLSPDGKVLVKFQQEDYPRLMWKKATDVEALGMPNRALEIRVALAKNYPSHPDFESWTEEILAKLDAIKKASEESGGADGTATASPTPAPAQ